MIVWQMGRNVYKKGKAVENKQLLIFSFELSCFILSFEYGGFYGKNITNID